MLWLNTFQLDDLYNTFTFLKSFEPTDTKRFMASLDHPVHESVELNKYLFAVLLQNACSNGTKKI